MSTESVEKQMPPPNINARVFVIEMTHNVNIKAALEYGGLTPLFKETARDEFDKDKPSQWQTSKFMDEIVHRLEDYNYNPVVDYILIAGHMIPLIILISTIIREWDSADYVQVLFWSAKFQRYSMRKL